SSRRPAESGGNGAPPAPARRWIRGNRHRVSWTAALPPAAGRRPAIAGWAEAEFSVSDIDYRPARLDDAGEVHDLLLRLAADLPLLVDTLEREEALYALVRDCVRSGESWVAFDRDGRIVGAVLVEPNRRG